MASKRKTAKKSTKRTKARPRSTSASASAAPARPSRARRRPIVLGAGLVGFAVVGALLFAQSALLADVHRPAPRRASASPSPSATPAPLPLVVATPDLLAGPQPRYLAHEGGTYLGRTYTSSIGALDQSYAAGFRLTEVDLNLTSDGQVVLLHDWDSTIERVYGVPAGQRDLRTYLSDTAASTIRPAQLADLAAWLRSHPDTRVVLDSKIDAVTLLTKIAQAYPDLRPRFVAYIDAIDQYDAAIRLGFPNVGLLVGPGQYNPATLLAFARSHRLFLIAMKPETAEQQPPELFKLAKVYVWTINDPAERDHLFGLGAYGIVTDSLVPPTVGG